MTDTTAPRTAAGRHMAGMWGPRGDPVATSAFVEDVCVVEREAIEPLLALVRAAQDVIAIYGPRSMVRQSDRYTALSDALAALPESIRAASKSR